MKNTLSFLALAIISLLLASSCKDPEPAPTREDFIAGESCKTWVLHQVFLNSDDITDTEEQCKLDDKFTFCSNQVYQQNDNQIFCGIEPTHVNAYWSFNKEKTMLFINTIKTSKMDTATDSTNTILKDYLIEDLLKDYMKLTYEDKESGGSKKQTYKYIFYPE